MPPKAESRQGNKSPKAAKEPKAKKPTIGQLMEENAKLLAELEVFNGKSQAGGQKWIKIGAELLDGVGIEWRMCNHIPDDPEQITEEIWLEIVRQLVVKRRAYEVSLEFRTEQLERRVTEMSLDVARVSEKCRAYEQGLNRLLDCDDINIIKDQVYHLKVIAGEAYHICDVNNPTRDPEELFKIKGVTDRGGDAAREIIEAANKLDLRPPCRKMSGDTLLVNMYSDLLLYIMKELSAEKASEADWRTLGPRVGIPQAQIDEWKSLPLTNPAGRVLDAWIKLCPTTTVRLLHRHLMSPPMRCTILCKRITDFYEVR